MDLSCTWWRQAGHTGDFDLKTMSLRKLLLMIAGLPRDLAEETVCGEQDLFKNISSVQCEGRQLVDSYEHKYSNLSASLAGYFMAAHVSGATSFDGLPERYIQLVEQHVLQPLGMATTKVCDYANAPMSVDEFRQCKCDASNLPAGKVYTCPLQDE